MTQEEKSLLLKDLCSRLPYGVKIQSIIYEEVLDGFGEETDCVEEHIAEFNLYIIGKDSIMYNGCWIPLESCKPYLRQMSSMTEDEIEELKELTGTDEVKRYGFSYQGLIGECFGIMYDDCSEIVDWLNAHHFDHHGLIEKGLALEAAKDMYNTK